MRLKKLLKLGVVFCGALVLLISCNKITEQQLAQLKELRAKEKSLQEEINKKKPEKASLETEVAARKKEYDDCASRRDFIKQKLATWPDAWPDWKPAPPPEPEPAPVKK
ncbi:MAG: hypothetical protein HW421_163 [Ignavibacteria bacterium]|nr:hypothetical protein [Ignavibacteria bacterium]